MKKEEAIKNFYIFSPGYEKELLEKQRCGNFGLYFSKMVHWQIENKKIKKDTGIENIDTDKIDEKTGKNKTSPQKVRDDYAENPCKRSTELFSSAAIFLANRHKRQNAVIADAESKGLKVITIKAKLTSPFITGLGSGHPTETGMILDRNTGLPCLPASSIKGVLRLAYAISIADKDGNADDEKIAKYFGGKIKNEKGEEKDFRGQLVILDAFPEKIKELKTDIMNPHFRKYYSGENKQPVETESPDPIKFLVVPEGTVFCFRAYLQPIGKESFTDADVSKIEKAFSIAFEKLGFGGKTAIGYGRFKKEDKTQTISAVQVNTVTLKKGDIVTVFVKDKPAKGRNVMETCLKNDKNITVMISDIGNKFNKAWLTKGAEFTVEIDSKLTTGMNTYKALAKTAKPK